RRELVPYAIEKLQGAGYKLVTVAECMGEGPYQLIQAPGKKDVRRRMLLQRVTSVLL
ncbi:hypothetical protein BDV98DRAFT_516150, partial [Pterulicium gracile]